MAEVKAAILADEFLSSWYEIGEKYIRTVCGRVEFKFAGLNRNIDSIKSKSRILLCWADEAEPITETAWAKLIPTVREDESEIWVTWNPESKRSATHKRFREDATGDMKIVELNWRDNPRFPAVLEAERLRDKAKRPDSYGHIWEGEMKTLVEGAYYASHLLAAKEQKRIGRVGEDPLMTKYAVFDIGSTSDLADATAIWIVQFIGKEIRVLDYYEAQGQPLSTHVAWLRRHGYESAHVVLPHDGRKHDYVYDVTYESALREAGFEVTVVPNQGKGAAMMRVEAARRMFPNVWFHEEATEAGREALGWYHEKRDEERKVGLGPNHDWASHGADAFGLIAVFNEGRSEMSPEPLRYRARKLA